MNAPPPVARVATFVGMVAVFGATFLLRFARVRFSNDHFTHLSRARQILLGDWPIRDFFDPGQFLHYYASAGAQWLFGYNLFGEALLTIGFIAFGAALTFGASHRLSGSSLTAVCVTVLSVIAFPRLYNYPKVFLYPGALWLAWWFAHAPTPRRTLALAGFTVLAFLFRYDHGVYIGLMMAVLISIVHGGDWRASGRGLARFGLLCAMFLLPFAAYVQWATGLLPYLVSSARTAGVVGRVAARLPDLRVTTAASVQTVAAHGWLTPENALAWFTGITVAMPYLTLGLCAWEWKRRRVGRSEASAVVAMAILGAIVTRALVSSDPNARLADVVAVSAVLAAWSAGRLLAFARADVRGRLTWVTTRGLLVALMVVTFWSVGTQAQLREKLADTDFLLGGGAAWENLKSSYQVLHLRPIDYWAPPGQAGALQALMRYALHCTEPTDRLLVAGAFAPEVYFVAERGFAGGQVHFLPGWHYSPDDQRLTVERIARQSVPVALIGDDEARFRRRFPLVADYLDLKYTAVPFTYEGGPAWRVLVERTRTPVSTYAPLGLPCFAPRTSSRD